MMFILPKFIFLLNKWGFIIHERAMIFHEAIYLTIFVFFFCEKKAFSACGNCFFPGNFDYAFIKALKSLKFKNLIFSKKKLSIEL